MIRLANRFAQSRDPALRWKKRMRREYIYYVYIMQSASRRALYIGMTNNLHKRVFQHKRHAFEGFTDRYSAVRLVHWESFDDVHKAIDREKQLKRWRREKKIWLIERKNPSWNDLAADWYETQGPSTAVRAHSVSERPRSG
jgi:putative endonuclease